MSLPLPALIHQLRTAYPAASLTSELLATQFNSESNLESNSNIFVVRALIQMGSFVVATGLAAAADIEAAEDRAKCRAIETLMLPAAASLPTMAAIVEPTDIAPSLAPVPPVPPIVQSAPGSTGLPAARAPQRDVIAPKTEILPVAPASTEPQLAGNAVPEALTDWDNPLRSTSSPSLDLDFDLNTLLQDSNSEPAAEDLAEDLEDLPLPAADLFAAVNSDSSAAIDPPVNLADLNLKRLTLPNSDDAETAAEKPSRRKTTAAAPPEPALVAPPAEIDRSGEIARIGVEMKRLGWDTKKGRDHLQKTYGKRSRQELNDDELMDFLRYLETQPSSAQMPF